MVMGLNWDSLGILLGITVFVCERNMLCDDGR
jgi:hypothetical protein